MISLGGEGMSEWLRVGLGEVVSGLVRVSLGW